MAPKIIVFGSLGGKLELAFAKLKTLHVKNDFSFAIVVGDFFSATESDDEISALLDGRIEIPVTTYFTLGRNLLPERIIERLSAGEEICENLVFLGRRSVTKTSDGVRIVALGGLPSLDAETQDPYAPGFDESEAKTLKGANAADILLTTAWPAGVTNGARAIPSVAADKTDSSEVVAELCETLRPSYHLAPSPDGGVYYEREPFFYPPKEGGSAPPYQITRFISMGAFGNMSKAKSMYAFTLQTTADALPQGSTVSPFAQQRGKKRLPDQNEEFARFDNGDGHHYAHHGRNGRKGRKGHRGERLPPPGPQDCFLCLASSRAENHMVTSVGNDTYLATAKGPLPTPTMFSKLGLPSGMAAHMLIIPQGHHAAVSKTVMGDDLAQSTFKEMMRLRDGLQAMVSSLSKHRLGTVTWEINRANNIHAHWQFLPCPANLIKKKHVEAAFRIEAENLELPKLINKDFEFADEISGDFLRIWIWCEDDGDGEDAGEIISKSLLMRFDESVRFDLQYPRKVMAKLLGLEDRTFWQDCVQTTEEETAEATMVRNAFKPWDFTLED